MCTYTINVQTVGLSLLSYSSPTDDGEPTGSVIVEAHYAHDYTTIEIIAGVSAGVSVPFIIIMIWIACVSACICIN